MDDILAMALKRATDRGLKIRGVGVMWVTAESYPRLLEISEDRDDLPQHYEGLDGFTLRVGTRFDARVAKGVPVEKVLIDVDQLEAFCRELGVPVNNHSRSVFTSITMAGRDANAGNA